MALPASSRVNNHIHIIWQMLDEHVPTDVQHSFMKYTAQMMLKALRNNHPKVLFYLE